MRVYTRSSEATIASPTSLAKLMVSVGLIASVEAAKLGGSRSIHWIGWQSNSQEVQVVRNNPEFDCQTWVMNALWLLMETGKGIIDPHINELFIRDELEAEDERWEVADHTLFERM